MQEFLLTQGVTELSNVYLENDVPIFPEVLFFIINEALQGKGFPHSGLNPTIISIYLFSLSIHVFSSDMKKVDQHLLANLPAF